jgi:hypothetical protein
MDAESDQARSTRAIRSLSIAVWALVIVLVANVAVSLYEQFATWNYPPYSWQLPSTSSRQVNLSSVDALANFYDWPVDKQIQNSSVIALTAFKQDGQKLKSVIVEILKQQPGTAFPYQVGDEYARGTRYVRENTTYGDGELIFFTGSPATMRYSSTYSEGRLLGMGDMPLRALRETIAKQSAGVAK